MEEETKYKIVCGHCDAELPVMEKLEEFTDCVLYEIKGCVCNRKIKVIRKKGIKIRTTEDFKAPELQRALCMKQGRS